MGTDPTTRARIAAMTAAEAAIELNARDPYAELERTCTTAAEAVKADPETVYQIAGEIGKGGVGTVYKARDRYLGRDVALGIVPLGTANLLARDLGMPTDPARAADALADTEVRRIDVGRVNGEPFLCASMMGLRIFDVTDSDSDAAVLKPSIFKVERNFLIDSVGTRALHGCVVRSQREFSD